MAETIKQGSARSIKTIVVGAGLSGLEVARQLQRGGDAAIVLEATNRIGGVVQTLESASLGVYEAGAEFIDREHKQLIKICRELGVELSSIYGTGKDDYSVVYHKSAQTRGEVDFGAAMEAVVPMIVEDQAILAKSACSPDQELRAAWLKQASVEDYLGDLASKLNPTKAWVLEMVKLIHEAEYAGSAKELSAIEFLATGYEAINRTNPSPYEDGYGELVVHGGSERIIDGMRKALSATEIRLGTPVEAVTELADGRYEVGFGSQALIANNLVLAAPTPALRSVDLSRAPLSIHQREAIRELGWGVSSKTFVGYNSDPTAGVEFRNETYSAELKGCIWKAAQYREPGSPGVCALVILRGGDDARASLSESPSEVVEKLEKIFPGSRQQYSGGFGVHLYDENTQYEGGSWIAPLPGQDNLNAAFLRPAKNIIFAGSGVDREYYGYMEGAVRAAQRAYRLLRNR